MRALLCASHYFHFLRKVIVICNFSGTYSSFLNKESVVMFFYTFTFSEKHFLTFTFFREAELPLLLPLPSLPRLPLRLHLCLRPHTSCPRIKGQEQFRQCKSNVTVCNVIQIFIFFLFSPTLSPNQRTRTIQTKKFKYKQKLFLTIQCKCNSNAKTLMMMQCRQLCVWWWWRFSPLVSNWYCSGSTCMVENIVEVEHVSQYYRHPRKH